MAAPTYADYPSFRPPFIPVDPLARATVWVLLAIVATSWIAVGVDLHELGLLWQASGGEHITATEREAWSFTQRVVFSLRAGLFAVTAVVFLTWLWQTRVNLRAMGLRRMRWARHWVVSSFLIPGLNVFRPYQVMREVWQGSHPDNLDPFNWRSVPVPPLLNLWWGAFVVWLGLASLAVLLGLGGGVTIPKLQLVSGVRLLSDVLAAVAAFLGIFVVGRISDAQDHKRLLQKEVEAADARAALAGVRVPG